MHTLTHSPILDSFTSDFNILKHNTLSLHTENTEIKKHLMDLTNSRLYFNQEIRSLKSTISQLFEQYAILSTSHAVLTQEMKGLARDNMQIKSKYDILQLRVKSLQGTSEHDMAQPPNSARRQHSSTQQNSTKSDGTDFQLSPRLGNIEKPGTKGRLENLKKDLEDVFNGKERKKTVTDEWSNLSELNMSRTHSERSQLTEEFGMQSEQSLYTKRYPTQVMQKSSDKDNKSIRDTQHRMDGSTNTRNFNGDSLMEIGDSSLSNFPPLSIIDESSIKPFMPPQPSPRFGKQVSHSSQGSSAVQASSGAPQSGFISLEACSDYTVNGQSQDNGYGRAYEGNRQAGFNAEKPMQKKRFSLKDGEDMLMGVLSKLTQQPQQANEGFSTVGYQSERSRYTSSRDVEVNKGDMSERKGVNYGEEFTRKVIGALSMQSVHDSSEVLSMLNISGVSNGKGTKKLKLVRKSGKPREDGNQSEMGSRSPDRSEMY